MTEGTAVIYSSYGGIVDYAKLICENAPTVYYTLTVKKTGDGNGEITGSKEIYCDANCFSASAKFPAGSVIELTATEINDSSFGSWSGDCVVSADETSVCEITMLNDKEAGASFTKDTAFPTAYISAEETSVDAGKGTTVSWGSDNATSCVNDVNDTDKGWSGANQNNAVKGIYKTNVFGQNEERTYSVTCADNFGNKDSASVTISSSSDEIETPSVDFWSDPDIVVFGGTANLLWLSENTKTGQCLVMSSDDDSFSGKGKSVEDNGSTVTGILSKELSEYVYTIKCLGDDGSYAEDQTVVETKEKPCGSDCVTKREITIIASDIEATIVAGLSTKSKKGENSEVRVLSNYCKDSKFDFIFKYDVDGPGTAYWGSQFDIKGATLGTNDLIIKKIPGKTEAKKYPITLTATCIDVNDESKIITTTETINLIVKK